MPKPRSLFKKPDLRFTPLRFASIHVVIAILVMSFVAATASAAYLWRQWQVTMEHATQQEAALQTLQTKFDETTQALTQTKDELEQLRSVDQFKRNEELQAEIKSIQTEFAKTVTEYEEILKLKDVGVKTQALDTAFTKILTLLSKRNYTEAGTELEKLTAAIAAEQAKLATAASGINMANVPVIKEAPGNGYRRQTVESPVGTFVVDILAADLNGTRVQVETASASDCKDGCPVAALADYVARSGGYAGINGPYFCPAEYPSCAGKTNSYDTLIMNKSKTYFNSDNNIHSTVPAFIFSGSSARIVNSSAVGRDTGVDAVIAAQPMLLFGGEVKFGGDGDPKKGSRGTRSFIGSKGSTVYIGVVRSATVAEVGHVLKTMGLENALNLDSGGSTAFMVNGKYIAGPGRQTPFGIVLVRR